MSKGYAFYPLGDDVPKDFVWSRRNVNRVARARGFHIRTVFTEAQKWVPGCEWESEVLCINHLGLQETPSRITGSVALRYCKSSRTIRPTVVPFGNSAREEAGMRPDDLMKPDLVSEVVLMSSGMLIVVILILTVVAAVTRIALLP
jgi:hypothetical protein